MLTPSEAARISSHFNIYEHNWQFYQELLGEAVLLDDVLAYCDGSGLYLSAFPLSDARASLTAPQVLDALQAAFRRFPEAGIAFINIWGRFEDLPAGCSSEDGTDYVLAEQSDYYEAMFETIFDVEDFDRNRAKSAAKRLRNLRNSGISTEMLGVAGLSHAHLQIIERWMRMHEVSMVHREFFYTLKSYVGRDGVHVCEARKEGALVGLSIVAIVSDDRLVALNSFPMRAPGLKAGDALFAATIDFARQHGLRWIHRGYSANETLLHTKESWGSVSRTPPYREAFYARDESAAQMVAEGKFLWRLRLQELAAPA